MIDKLLVHISICDKGKSIESERKNEPFRRSLRVLYRAPQTVSQTRCRP